MSTIVEVENEHKEASEGEPGHVEVSGMDTSGVDNREEDEDNIVIPHTHPLFGSYEGSFMIPNHKGAEEEIYESFFFYALHHDCVGSIPVTTTISGSASSVVSPPDGAADTPNVPVTNGEEEGEKEKSLFISSTEEGGRSGALSSLPPVPRVSTSWGLQ